jgi:hypothetical protein
MTTTTSTRKLSLERPTCFGDAEGKPNSSNGHLAGIRSVDALQQQASDAVALAFATIVSQHYPGTSWLPVKRSGSNDSFVMPAGKVVRLLPGPANMHA